MVGGKLKATASKTHARDKQISPHLEEQVGNSALPTDGRVEDNSPPQGGEFHTDDPLVEVTDPNPPVTQAQFAFMMEQMRMFTEYARTNQVPPPPSPPLPRRLAPSDLRHSLTRSTSNVRSQNVERHSTRGGVEGEENMKKDKEPKWKTILDKE